MASIAVVYHSGYGHTQRQAQVIAEAAGGQLIAIDAEGNLPEAAWAQLDAADAIILGSPTYMGGPSWQFKKFADASSKRWYSRNWKNKIFAGFTNSASINGDKANTLNYFFALAMQHGGLWVGLGEVASNAKAATRNDINWLGVFHGAAAATPSDASVTEMLPGDLETSRVLGRRVAEAAARWNR
jgi:multimeric flavodoxin WrbA